MLIHLSLLLARRVTLLWTRPDPLRDVVVVVHVIDAAGRCSHGRVLVCSHDQATLHDSSLHSQKVKYDTPLYAIDGVESRSCAASFVDNHTVPEVLLFMVVGGEAVDKDVEVQAGLAGP